MDPDPSKTNATAWNLLRTFNTLPNGWTVIATVSRDFMMSDVQLMRDRTAAVALAAVCIALFFMFLVVCRVVAAMRKGVQFAESVAEGNLEPDLQYPQER